MRRESRTAKIYLQRDDIFREPYFFAPPLRGWHRADLKHNHLRFFFVLGLYSLSTLASLVHLNFSLLLYPGPSAPTPTLDQRSKRRDVKCLCSLLTLCVRSLCFSAYYSELKTSVVIYFFGYLCSLPSGITHTQTKRHSRYLLFTLKRKHLSCFEIHELTRPVKSQYITLKQKAKYISNDPTSALKCSHK